jgi:hypothetical protein
MGVAEADGDGDGLPDLFVTNARGQVHAAYHGQLSELVNPSFVDVRTELGVVLEGSTGWGVTWGDLDLDTDLDLFIVNGDIPVDDLGSDAEPLQVFMSGTAQGRPGVYEDGAAAGGLDAIGPLLARGSAAADFDNDGDLDVAINSIGGSFALLENTGTEGNSLVVDLGDFAPGAVVTVDLLDGRELVREARAGSSYLSSEDPRLLFGLGDSRQVSSITVRWPSGEETVVEDVEANRILTVGAPD